MRTTTLAGSKLRASRLGFGCAAVGSRYGRRESLDALARAFELGVSYFDVARAYGYGDAERIVGDFVRDKRDRIVLATKFGIDPPPASGVRTVAKAVARKVFRLLPGLRKAARAQLGKQFARPRIDATTMTASIEQSLQQLRTDRIDVLLVHDCPDEALDDDALFTALERLVASGKVGLLGVSGTREVVSRALERRPAVSLVQLQHDVFQGPMDAKLRACPSHATMAHHCLGGESGVAHLEAALRRGRTDPGAPASLRDKLRSLGEVDALAGLALGGVLADDGVSVALAAMFSPRHLEANARAVAEPVFDREEIEYLRAG